ncbi:hypothetical protein [Fibrella forsythiae]|uniref:Uncharacterized protein n=1 Tax=Fibrella forsythiae TaxID=2817061 RepID=A0ABS3JC48_9BACT|nr:hypothetical protein [Fibrella forsythiae]MBO0947570.1 hypothetical protein [Fibrella forsythiae]
MLKQLVIALSYLNSATLLIPVVIGIWFWNSLSVALRLSWWAILSYLLLFVTSFSIGLLAERSNTLLFQYLISGAFGSFFAAAYWFAVPTGWRKQLIAGLGVAGLAGLFFEAIVQAHYRETSLWSVPLETVLTTATVLLYLHYILRQTKINLLQIPFFWISIAHLISSVLGTIYDAFRPMMLASSLELYMVWLCFQLGITIFCNLLYGVGFYKTKNMSR